MINTSTLYLIIWTSFIAVAAVTAPFHYFEYISMLSSIYGGLLFFLAWLYYYLEEHSND